MLEPRQQRAFEFTDQQPPLVRYVLLGEFLLLHDDPDTKGDEDHTGHRHREKEEAEASPGGAAAGR